MVVMQTNAKGERSGNVGHATILPCLNLSGRRRSNVPMRATMQAAPLALRVRKTLHLACRELWLCRDPWHRGAAPPAGAYATTLTISPSRPASMARRLVAMTGAAQSG